MGAFRRAGFSEPRLSCLAIAHQGIEPPFAAYTTYEEALLVRKVLEDRRLRSVIVVTSSYHLRRTRMIFDHMLSGTKTDVMFSAAGNSAFSLDRWWKSHFGRKLILMEYLGLMIIGFSSNFSSRWVIMGGGPMLMAKERNYLND